MEFLYEFGLFLAKAITIAVACIVVMSAIAGVALRSQRKSTAKGDLVVENLNDAFEDTRDFMMVHLLEKKEYKLWSKAEESKLKKAEKQKAKIEKPGEKSASVKATETEVAVTTELKSDKPKLFVIGFDGDVQASETENMMHTIDAALLVAKPGDEFLCCLESPGGLVHAYGLASSQLRRIKDAGFKLTVCIDKVAASGGYMMACVADTILAAPFSIIGSIGVVAQIPNFNRVLKKHNVDIELHTAGEYKRTLTLFGENTQEAREKFREELEETHQLFKKFVENNRPQVDVAQVATGEHWYGEQALPLKLVDGITTSQDFIMKSVQKFDVYRLTYELKVPLMEKLGLSIDKGLARIMARLGLQSN